MRRGLTQILAVFAVFLAATGFSVPAHGVETGAEEASLLLTADEMAYDRDLGVVTASGNVEISDDDRVLLADTVSYNQRLDVLTASGNIRLLEPTGEVVFAEYVELTGDMKDGIIRNLRILLSDKARIAATGARRSDGTVLEMRRAVYSPCNLCPDDPTRPPLWQLKAVKVVHDKPRQSLEYTDAWFVGFDPTITVGVWIGYDEKKTIGNGETGSAAASPIWMEFMQRFIDVHGDRANPPHFEAPGNIVFVTLDSGITEAFISGTQPQFASARSAAP